MYKHFSQIDNVYSIGKQCVFTHICYLPMFHS